MERCSDNSVSGVKLKGGWLRKAIAEGHWVTADGKPTCTKPTKHLRCVCQCARGRTSAVYLLSAQRSNQRGYIETSWDPTNRPLMNYGMATRRLSRYLSVGAMMALE